MNQNDTQRRITVLLHISEPLLQAGVYAALASECDMTVIDVVPTQNEQTVDIVIIDSAAAAMIAEDGRHVELCSHFQLARILVIATQTREHAVRSALKQGIQGFVLTSSPLQELLFGVRTLARGGKYLCPPVAQQLSNLAERDALTNREDEVLRLVAKGMCNKLIARDLDIAVGTVKVHVKSIMSKLDASSRTEAASIATERGLVDLPASSIRPEPTHPFAKVWRASPMYLASFA